MESFSAHLIQMVNEAIIYICSVGMVLFSEYVSVTKHRWHLGYVFIALTCLCIAINVMITAYLGLCFIKTQLRQRKYRNKVRSSNL